MRDQALKTMAIHWSRSIKTEQFTFTGSGNRSIVNLADFVLETAVQAGTIQSKTHLLAYLIRF